ncbi:MAG: hypothetical protein KA717_16285 [Woronichinia naegeliana WA131]|uniref:Uncharacterized protein n=1 Tax=Woronichinia naegeliana WA131 TaxID=2824559 RepID=A0A977L1Q4_9CYAN|nr:MAG: hypothetical protein KA717_16285 [Woronichinia naegeliana WA131]
MKDVFINLSDVQKQARKCGLDTSMLEALLQAIEQNLIQRSLSNKYKAMFYLAATGLYSAEELAQIFKHSSKNMNADFNKNLGVYLKLYLELDEDERVGITSLRRILFRKGYFVDINDEHSVRVLPTRHTENSELELPVAIRHN